MNKVANFFGILSGLLLVSMIYAESVQADDFDAKQLFERECMACHTIGDGDMVGPDLEGLTSRRERTWLLSFIASPRDMKEQEDPVALELGEEYPAQMPDFKYLDEDEIKALIDFIAKESGDPPEDEGADKPEEEETGYQEETDAQKEVQLSDESDETTQDEQRELALEESEKVEDEPATDETERSGKNETTKDEQEDEKKITGEANKETENTIQAEAEEAFSMSLTQIVFILVSFVIVVISNLLRRAFTA